MAYSTTPWCMHMALGIQLLLSSMLVLPVPGAESSGYYRRAELIHVDANGGFTREELIRRAADRAHLRAAMLSSADRPGKQDEKMKVQLESQYSHFEYLMPVEVDMDGKPLRFVAVADTGSDLVWMKKEMGSSYEPVPCSCTSGKGEELFAFNKTYGSGNKTAKGFICKNRKLSFLSPSKTKETERDGITLGFAIHYDHDLIPESANGIVGLNGGGLSLVKQLEDASHATFSYCLSNPLINEPLNSPFWFGGAPIFSDSDLKSTPLVKVLSYKDRYHVELLGISFDDGEKIELQEHYFNYKSEQGNGVMFIDSGCSYTFLETPVFGKLKKMLGETLGKEYSITKDDKLVHTCFPVKMAPTLDLVLHLKDGAQMRIPWANYMVQDNPESDFCLAINETAGVSILGNILQHNIYMHYDLTDQKQKLSFKQVPDCSKL